VNNGFNPGNHSAAVLSAILATPDPHATAEEFVRAGWTLAHATPPGSGDRLAIVELAGAQVMLGTDGLKFVSDAARTHQGAGVEFYVRLPDEADAEAIFRKHQSAGVVTEPLQPRSWGGRAFRAHLAGYRFMVATRK
jgi:uncharacterized glyoxalase superfamily protein PhnB